MKEKRYDGYNSYEYLEAGKDYEVIELGPALGRFPTYDLELTESQEQRVQGLLEENVVISLHEHPTIRPRDVNQYFEYNRTGRQFTAYGALAESGLDAVFDNFMNGTAVITSKKGWKWSDVIFDMGMRYSDFAHQDFVTVAQTVDDIVRAAETGRLALVPTLESATPCENEVDRVDVLYGLGIRSMGITYSESNMLGSGLRERSDGGLTVFGEQVVERMNQLGIAIDVSHTGDRTSLDVIRKSKHPILISHAGARAIWNTQRMKPDEVIKACAERGGVIGVEAAPHTTLSKDHPRHSIESVMDHFEYLVDLVGIDHVSFGPDTNFGDHVGVHRMFAEHLSTSYKKETPSYEQIEYVAGMENPAECVANAVRWLVKHGYSDDEIRKVIGENTLRVLRQVWWPHH